MRIKLSDLHILRDFSGAWRLEATIADDCVKALQAFIDKARGKFISAELAEWREKRSLDANSYAWVLMPRSQTNSQHPARQRQRTMFTSACSSDTVKAAL